MLRRCWRKREADEDGGAGFVLILDFGFGEGGFGAVAPLDGFLALVDAAFVDESGEGADDVGFVFGIEGEVGIVPVAEDAEASEAFFLSVDPVAGEVFAATSDFRGFFVAGVLHDLEFDGEAMAVPSGDVGGFEAGHGFAFYHEVF